MLTYKISEYIHQLASEKLEVKEEEDLRLL